MTRSILLAVILEMAVSPSIAVAATPVAVTLPSIQRFCVQSQPVDASNFDLQEVRDALSDKLNSQLQSTALGAGLSTVGVPYADSIVTTPAPQAPSVPVSPGGPTAATAQPTVTVKECMVVPPAGRAALPAAGLETVPAHEVYATLCQADQIAACQRDLETAIRANHSSSADAARSVVFRTRQAISTAGDSNSLIAALTDFTLIVLRDDATKPATVGQAVVESAEFAP